MERRRKKERSFKRQLFTVVLCITIPLAVLLAFGTPIKSLITKLWAKKKA